MSDKLYSYNVQREQVSNMKLQNDLLKQQVEAAKIANAKAGVFTPAYETGGRIVDTILGKIGPWIEGETTKTVAEAPDIVQEVIDNANAPTGVLPAVPSALAVADRIGRYTRFGRREIYAWRKGFWESFRDAQYDHYREDQKKAAERRNEEQKNELTPDKVGPMSLNV